MEKRLEGIPPDLLVAVILALATLVFTLTPLNYLLGNIPQGLLIVLLFVPGYALCSALFPKTGDLGRIARAALSFGLGVAVVPLIILALNYTPWGIGLIPIAASLAFFTLFTAAAAYWRRLGIPKEERFSIQLGEKIDSLKREILADDKGRLDKALTVILVLTIVASVAALVYVIVSPKQGEKFTEFYILGPGGKAYDYPTSVQAGNKSTLIVGVVNHEYKLVNYTMQISLNDTPIDDALMNTAINRTLGNGSLLNETILNSNISNNNSSDSTLLNDSPLSNILLINTSKQEATMNHSSMENASLEDNSQFIFPIMSMNLTLQNNETWERPVTYTLNNTGDRQKLELLLYKEGNFTEPYRDLHLWVNVTGAASYSSENATNLTAARGSERNIR